MKRVILGVLGFGFAAFLVFAGVFGFYALTMPEYRNSLGNDTDESKLKGLYLLKRSAEREDNLIIYGSSELRTFGIPQNPANFFKGKRGGLQVNLFGRGSSQSIIHALSIASSGEALRGKKVVLITSPQSYVPEGIAPDLFFANFSELQYLELMLDDSVDGAFKLEFSKRLANLVARYEQKHGKLSGIDASIILARLYAKEGRVANIVMALLKPYFLTAKNLAALSDLHNSKVLLEAAEADFDSKDPAPIDWAAERERALEEAEKASDSNDFGIENGYYSTYIGSKLARQKDKDKALSYSESEEYADLELLMQVLEAKGVEALFIHVPLHAEWSDYTGFEAKERLEYYEKVRNVVQRYDVKLLDLTKNEYEPYYLCDVMHLGWKGWLDANEAMYGFFAENRADNQQ